MTTTATPLAEAVTALATMRRGASESAAVLADLQRQFAEQNAGAIARAKQDREIAEAQEIMVRALALAAYQNDRTEKKPAPGIEIKTTKVYTLDEVAGLVWAKEKQLCLVPESLDVPAVKKLATVQPLPFVQVAEEPKAFIASDLDKAIAAAAEA